MYNIDILYNIYVYIYILYNILLYKMRKDVSSINHYITSTDMQLYKFMRSSSWVLNKLSLFLSHSYLFNDGYYQ